MRKILFAFFFLGFILLFSTCSVGLSSGQSTATLHRMTKATTLTPQPTLTVSLTNTTTSTYTLTPQPTPTQTLQLPVSYLTAVPETSEKIGILNSGSVTALAKWGEGVVYDAQFSPEGKEIFILATSGLYRISAETFDVIEFMENITAFSISPDGTFFVTRDRDKTITLFRINGEEDNLFLVPENFLSTSEYTSYWLRSEIIISSNSKFVAAICLGNVRLWDSETGRLLLKTDYFEKGFQEIIISNDCKKLLAIHTINQVSVWNLETFELEKTIKSKHDSLTSMAMTSNGERLLFSARSGKMNIATVWDTSRFSRLFDLSRENESLYTYALSPDGNVAVTANYSTIRFWNLNNGSLINRFELENMVYDLNFSSDGKFCSASYDKGVIFYEMENLEEYYKLDYSLSSQRYAVFLNNSSKFFIYAQDTGVISLGDIEAREMILEKPLFSAEITSLVYLENQDLFVFGGANGYASIVNGEDGRIIKKIDLRAAINKLSLSPDEKYLAISKNDGDLVVFNTENWKLFCNINSNEHDGWLNAVFSPSGDSLVSYYDRWSFPECEILEDLTPKYSFCSPSATWSLTFSVDRKQMIIGCYDGSILFWDVGSNSSVRMDVHTMPVQNLSFSSSGDLLVTTSFFDPIYVWRYPENELLRTFLPKGRSTAIFYSAIFSDDEEMLIAGDSYGNIYFWSLITGAEWYSVNSYRSEIKGLEFIKDGEILVSFGTGGEVILWGIP